MSRFKNYQDYKALVQKQIDAAVVKTDQDRLQTRDSYESPVYMSLVNTLNSALHQLAQNKIEALNDARQYLSRPPKKLAGENQPDYALPMFEIARALQFNPVELAAKMVDLLKDDATFKSVSSVGPYVNISLEDGVLINGIGTILDFGQDYGKLSDCSQRVVVIDFSSPNVAKPFGINHLRSTVIGEALARLFDNSGFTVVRDNHLGDWGTQFGNLLAAYYEYSAARDFDSLSMDELNELYVRFSQAKKDSPELVKKGQSYFSKLEQGDQDLLEKWTAAVSLSLDEFSKMYDRLNINFDTLVGESYFTDSTKEVIDILNEAPIKDLVEFDSSSQAIIIKGEHPVVLRTSDGYFVYAARDLATIAFRIKAFKPSVVSYVVGEEQASYFRSVFEVADRAGLTGLPNGQKAQLEFIGFGLLLDKEGKKLSTRKGTSGKLEDVINTLDAKALSETKKRNPGMDEAIVKSIASKVAVGAIIWNDLRTDRNSSVRFDIDRMLELGGDSVVDVLYTYSRTCSILRKLDEAGLNRDSSVTADSFSNEHEHLLALRLNEFSEVLRQATTARSPHILVAYLQELAQMHGRFYEGSRVIGLEDSQLFNLRVALHDAYKIVIENGLYLLNIPVTERL